MIVEALTGSTHTSGNSLQLMKLCGVIVLVPQLGYVLDKIGRAAETISRHVIHSASEVTDGMQVSVFRRGGGRSDRGTVEGMGCRSLMTARTRTRSEPRNAIHAAMRAKN